MCIPFGAFDPSAPPILLSQRATKLKSAMQVILILHLFIIVGKIFVLSAAQSFNDIIGCFLLQYGLASANFCHIMFYEVLCLFSCFQTLINIGLMIQVRDYGTDPKITIGFVSILVIFYAIAIYYSFQTYREIKALHFEQLGEVESFSIGEKRSFNYGSNNAEGQAHGFDAFRGQGVRLGDYQ